MAKNSGIEWTDATWNPVTGCSKISDGCANCYAERMALRLQKMGSKRYANGFEPTMHEAVLNEPFKWKKPKRIFVNSMGDLFHPKIKTYFIRHVFNVMKEANHHTFQVSTKRSSRLLSAYVTLVWSPNVWMGVTVENEKYIHRIDRLRKVPARLKFISFEPLLGPIPVNDINWSGIRWVIIGGESGPGARPMKGQWALDIIDKCQKLNILVFFKQWGGTNKKEAGCEINGRLIKQFPETN